MTAIIRTTLLFALLLAGQAPAAALLVKTEQVVVLTRFLEQQPLDPSAPAIRAGLLRWEDGREDVINWVCTDVLAPIPADDVPNSPQLLAQFIFGSAAHQVAHPADMGKLVPGQLAGMRSMLKAYHALLAADPKARIPRLDDLSRMDADGTLPAYLEPVAIKACGKAD